MLTKLKPRSEFSRNVLTLMTGTTIAQAIPIAISPILTRIYTPEDFGVFALYMSIASILSVVATGRYEMAIMLPKKDEDAINIMVLSIAISFFVSFISFLIVFIFNTQITELLGNPEISNWLYFIPVTVLLTGIYQSFNYWSNRKKQYKRLATSRVIQSSAASATNLGMGFGGFGTSGLIFGQLIGQSFAVTVLGKMVFREMKSKFLHVKRLKIIAMVKRYLDFPKHSLPTAFLDVMSLNLPLYLINILFSVQLLGYYSFAYRMIQFPSALVSGAFSQVFYQKFSSLAFEPLEQKKFLILTWLKLFFIGFFPFLLVFIYGSEIFAFVFGENWREAGKIASILSVMLFFVFVSSPTSSAFVVLRMQKIGLYFGISVLIYRPLALYYGYLMNDFWLGLKLMTLFESIQIVVYNIIILFKLKDMR
ncbi:MAG: hypothetical protein QG617_542 [Campylobacterota bacterium]|nr:hypothetical protein [Campylobacterota bacterium]